MVFKIDSDDANYIVNSIINCLKDKGYATLMLTTGDFFIDKVHHIQIVNNNFLEVKDKKDQILAIFRLDNIIGVKAL